MAQYDDTNRGALFRNKDKTEGDRKPDYTGMLDVEGHKYRIAAWLKTSKAGLPFLSLNLTEATEQKKSSHKPLYDDDVAF